MARDNSVEIIIRVLDQASKPLADLVRGASTLSGSLSALDRGLETVKAEYLAGLRPLSEYRGALEAQRRALREVVAAEDRTKRTYQLAVRSLAAVETELRQVNALMAEQSRGARTLSRLWADLGRMGGNLSTIVGSGGLTYALAAAAREAYQAEVGVRLFRRQLERMNLDVADGEDRLKRIADRLGVLPQQIADYATQLLRQGLTMRDITTLFEGAAASALAAGKDVLTGIDAVTNAVVNQQSIYLNYAGIAENLDIAYKEYAKTLGKTVDALTKEERARAAVLLVQRATKEEVADLDTLLGGLTGSQTRLNRELARFRQELGDYVTPVLSKVLEEASDALDLINRLPEPIKAAGAEAVIAATGVSALAVGLGVLRSAVLPFLGPAGWLLLAAGGFGALVGAMASTREQADAAKEALEAAKKQVSTLTAELRGAKDADDFVQKLQKIGETLDGQAKKEWAKYIEKVRETKGALSDLGAAADDAGKKLLLIQLGRQIEEAQKAAEAAKAAYQKVITTGLGGKAYARLPDWLRERLSDAAAQGGSALAKAIASSIDYLRKGLASAESSYLADQYEAMIAHLERLRPVAEAWAKQEVTVNALLKEQKQLLDELGKKKPPKPPVPNKEETAGAAQETKKVLLENLWPEGGEFKGVGEAIAEQVFSGIQDGIAKQLEREDYLRRLSEGLWPKGGEFAGLDRAIELQKRMDRERRQWAELLRTRAEEQRAEHAMLRAEEGTIKTRRQLLEDLRKQREEERALSNIDRFEKATTVTKTAEDYFRYQYELYRRAQFSMLYAGVSGLSAPQQTAEYVKKQLEEAIAYAERLQKQAEQIANLRFGDGFDYSAQAFRRSFEDARQVMRFFLQDGQLTEQEVRLLKAAFGDLPPEVSALAGGLDQLRLKFAIGAVSIDDYRAYLLAAKKGLEALLQSVEEGTPEWEALAKALEKIKAALEGLPKAADPAKEVLTTANEALDSFFSTTIENIGRGEALWKSFANGFVASLQQLKDIDPIFSGIAAAFNQFFDDLEKASEQGAEAVWKAVARLLLRVAEMALIEILITEAKEVAKATIEAPLTLGATLAAIAPITLAATAGIAGIEALKARINAYEVGAPEIPVDQLAVLHRGEMVVPASFAEAVRRGELAIGFDTSSIVRELRDVKALLADQRERTTRLELVLLDGAGRERLATDLRV